MLDLTATHQTLIPNVVVDPNPEIQVKPILDLITVLVDAYSALANFLGPVPNLPYSNDAAL